MLEICLDNKHLLTSDPLKKIVDQIQMLLFTKPGDVLGEPEFGVDLHSYLFELQFSAADMRKYILYQINKYIPYSTKHNIDVQVRLFSEDLENVAFVDIIINNIPIMGIHVK